MTDELLTRIKPTKSTIICKNTNSIDNRIRLYLIEFYLLEKTLWCRVVVSTFIGQVRLTHVVHLLVNMCNKSRHRLAHIRLHSVHARTNTHSHARRTIQILHSVNLAYYRHSNN